MTNLGKIKPGEMKLIGPYWFVLSNWIGTQHIYIVNHGSSYCEYNGIAYNTKIGIKYEFYFSLFLKRVNVDNINVLNVLF